MTAKTPVACYGLYRQLDLVFLLEQKRAACLNAGLERISIPYEVTLPHWLRCPHNFPEPAAGSVPRNRLVQMAGPRLSGREVFQVASDANNLMWQLAQMTGVTPQVPWTLRKPIERLTPQLTLTNAAPLIILGYEPKHFSLIHRLLELPRTRTLILSGYPTIPGIETLDHTGLAVDRDWRAVGAALLHRYVVSCQR